MASLSGKAKRYLAAAAVLTMGFFTSLAHVPVARDTKQAASPSRAASPAFTKASSFRFIPSKLVTRSDTSSRRKKCPGISSRPISPINGSSFNRLLIVCGSLMASAKCHQVKIEQRKYK